MGRISDDNFSIDALINSTIIGAGDSGAHLMTLFSLSLSMGAKNIIELGVCGGFTIPPFLLAVEKLNGTLHSVDIIKRRKLDVPEHLQPYWKFYEMDSIDFLKSWDKSVVPEIVYVDDLHSYDHVSKELKLLESIVNPSSIILLHDTMYYNTEPKYHIDLKTKTLQWKNGGPAQAVLTLDRNVWEWATIPRCNGLTLLRKSGGITQQYRNKTGQLVSGG